MVYFCLNVDESSSMAVCSSCFLSLLSHGYPKEFFCKAISVHVEVDMHEMYQPRKGKMSVFLIVEKPG